jgi:PAS domain S-box-containing protein
MPETHYLKDELYELIKNDDAIFEFIQMASLDGMWYWDLEHPEHEWMNAKFWTTLGYDPADMPHLADAWQDIINPDDLQEMLENFRKHVSDPNHPYDQLVRYRHKDGSTVWIHCRGMAIRDENGTPIRMLGAHNDVTTHKEAEIRQRKNAEAYQALLDNNKAYVIKTDAEANYTYANDLFLTKFNLERDAILGTSSMNTIYVADHPKAIDAATACLENPHQPVNVSLRKHMSDGTFKTTDWEFTGLTDDAGNTSEILCIGVDVTKQVEAEADLQRTKRLLEDAGRIANMGGWELDVTKGIEMGVGTFTDQMYAIHELPKGTALDSETAFAFYHPEDRHIIEDAVNRAVEQQIPYDIQCRFVTAKGNHRWVRTSGYPVIQNGQVTRLIGMFQDITEQKEAELALRKSEAQHRNLFENAMHEVHLWELVRDEQGAIKTWRLTEANPAALKAWGKTRSEIIGKTANEIFAYDATAQFMPIVKKIFVEGAAHTWEAYVASLDQFLYMTSVPFGEYFMSTGIDITDRKQAELALRESKTHLELFFSQSLTGFFFMMLDEPIAWHDDADKDALLEYVLDHDRITKANQAFANQYKGNVLGRTVREFFPNDPDTGKALWRELFDRGHWHVEIENNDLRPDDSPHIVEGDYTCLYDDQGRITGHFGVQQDVTARKHAERALADSEAKFRSLVENANDVIVMLSPQGEYLYISPKGKEITGVSPEGFIGQSFEVAVHPEDIDKVQQALDTIVSSKQAYEGIVYRAFHGDGSWHWYSSSGAPLFDDAGNVSAIMTIIRDITHDKAAEKTMQATLNRLEQTVSQNTMLMKEIHHRVKNNLAVISALLALRARDLKDPIAKDALKESRDRIKVMAEVHELMYHHDSNERIAFERYLSGLVDRMKRSFAYGKQPITFALEVAQCNIGLDQAVPLGLIINELLTNASKHAFPEDHPDPRITVTATADNSLTLTVTDNGVGVDDTSALETSESLGMTVINSLTEQLEGNVTFANRPSNDVGLQVTLRVPLA